MRNVSTRGLPRKGLLVTYDKIKMYGKGIDGKVILTSRQDQEMVRI